MTGFDRAQVAYDTDTPDHLDDVREGGGEWCDNCGDQAVCPECVGT